MRLFEVYQTIRVREDNMDAERLDRRRKEILSMLEKNPEIIHRVYRLLRTELDVDDRFDPRDYLSTDQTAPERDHSGHEEELIQALTRADGDFDELQAFVMNYGQVDFLNLDALTREGQTVSFSDWIQGSKEVGVSADFVKSLFASLYHYQPQAGDARRGPGEMSIALLSPNVTYLGAQGDLVIGGKHTEVKSAGGRLRESDTRDFGSADQTVNELFDRAGLTQYRVRNLTSAPNPRSHHNFVIAAKDLAEASDSDTAREMIRALFQETYHRAASGKFRNDMNLLVDQIIKEVEDSSPDLKKCQQLANQIAMLNYSSILISNQCEYYLFLNHRKRSSLFIPVEQLLDHVDKFQITGVTWAGEPKALSPGMTLKS